MKIRWFVILAIPAVCHLPVSGAETVHPPADVEAETARLLDRGSRQSKEGKLLEAVKTFRRAVRLAPGDPEAHTFLGMALISIWRYPEARAALNRARALDRWYVPAMVWLAQCEMHTFEYVRSFRWLHTALLLSPDDPDALAVLATLLLDVDELDLAKTVLERALARDPRHAMAKACKGNLKILRKDPASAAKEFDFLLREAPWNVQAYFGMAQVLCQRNRPREAFLLLDKALKRNPFLPSLYAWRGYVLHRMKRAGDALKEYRKALRMDPEYSGGHLVYSFRPGSPAEDSPPSGDAGRHFRQSILALNLGDFPLACRRAAQATAMARGNLKAWLVRGSASYGIEDYGTVLKCARKAQALDPEAPLPHVLFIAGWNLKKERKKQDLVKRDFHDRFRALEAPEVPGIERVFRNYGSLNEDGKKVVRRAAGPLGRFLGVLATKGAGYIILPLHSHITDVPGMAPWKGKKTFDGRYWDAVRGAAGMEAVMGVEKIWTATRMGFSTVAHEFAHLVHRHALPEVETSEITRLFNKAKKEGRCLDFYAAENEEEYFAQGYEAFVSPFKRPTVSETDKNTHDDLKRKDPDLFRFLTRITGGK